MAKPPQPWRGPKDAQHTLLGEGQAVGARSWALGKPLPPLPRGFSWETLCSWLGRVCSGKNLTDARPRGW